VQPGRALFARIGVEELAALPRQHSFVDALESLLIAASSGSLAKSLATKATKLGTGKNAVAPIIEVVVLTPGSSANIRITGVRKGGGTAHVNTPCRGMHPAQGSPASTRSRPGKRILRRIAVRLTSSNIAGSRPRPS
jgi:hypothetical protein